MNAAYADWHDAYNEEVAREATEHEWFDNVVDVVKTRFTTKAWQHANKERCRLKQRAWRAAHPGHNAEYLREYRRKKKEAASQ